MKESRAKYLGSARASRANASPARTEGALTFANFSLAFRRWRRKSEPDWQFHARAHVLPNQE
jgi:hypothetical protein